MIIFYTILHHYLTYLILGVILILIFYKLTEIYYNMDTRIWQFNALYAIRWGCVILGMICITASLVLYKFERDAKLVTPIPIHKPDPTQTELTHV